MIKHAISFLRIPILCTFILVFCLALVACKNDDITGDVNDDNAGLIIDAPRVINGDKVSLVNNSNTEFKLVYGFPEELEGVYKTNINRIATAFEKQFGASLAVECENYVQPQCKYEIQVGCILRKKNFALTKTLADGEYALQVYTDKTADTVEICISHNGKMALLCAVERFIEDYLMESSTLPGDLSFRGSCSANDVIITSDIPGLRDPCILADDGTYYAYGTGWIAYKNTTGSLSNGWEYIGSVVSDPIDLAGDKWAPEVHKYGDRFYMFTTYRSTADNRRGCAIFVSDTPQGPFVPHSNGRITPSDWDSIDGTLYIDADGMPWLVFVHEWVSTQDKVGRMAACRLSLDLKETISEPIELFRADDPSWADDGITDGCFMYTMEDGGLKMIWSNFDKSGYVIAICGSPNGKIDGEWIQGERLFSKALTEEYDGGHGIIFTALDGSLYLSAHSPNDSDDGRPETPVFIKIQEEFGELVLNLYDKK